MDLSAEIRSTVFRRSGLSHRSRILLRFASRGHQQRPQNHSGGGGRVNQPAIVAQRNGTERDEGHHDQGQKELAFGSALSHTHRKLEMEQRPNANEWQNDSIHKMGHLQKVWHLESTVRFREKMDHWASMLSHLGPVKR